MKIAVITTSRADYGLLYWLLIKLKSDNQFILSLVVSGTHLLPAAGLTYKRIEEDGFKIDRKIDIMLGSDTAVGASKSLALAIIGFGEAFEDLKPDLILLLGDRYEMMGAAQAANLHRIPIAHLAGGDITEGAFDDSFRHCLTKMAHIHFPTNTVAAERIVQMGENPENVFVVGSPGVDYIHQLKKTTRSELAESLKFEFREKNILVTFHPETLVNDTFNNCAELIAALKSFDPATVGIVITLPNADPGGQEINRMFAEFAYERANVAISKSLGSQNYLSLMREADVVVGNSSSGFYEAPSMPTPTVNIGDRQLGRIAAASVFTVEPKAQQIADAIQSAFTFDCSNVTNPYGDGNASEKIMKILKTISDPTNLLRKRFCKVNMQ